MQGEFELNKLGWYTVKTVEPNDYLNDRLENDQYGIYYNVAFEGDANNHLWQAKTAPLVGQRVYGHIELTKSGKTTKFRRAKKEDTPQESQASVAAAGKSQTTSHSQSTDESIARAVALKAAVEFHGSGTSAHENVITETADTFLAWLQGSSESTNPKAEQPRTIAGDPPGTVGHGIARTSGYEKFKASRPPTPEPHTTYQRAAEAEYGGDPLTIDPELKSLLESTGGEPVDMPEDFLREP